MFKRVREGVVRDTQEQQVPWESSSLQGEFAFVPGVGAAKSRRLRAAETARPRSAFWNSMQASTRADEYRAYLRQYPKGRFVALAQSRSDRRRSRRVQRSAAAATGPAVRDARRRHARRPPDAARAGDTWRYRVQDSFRLGDLFVTARVDAVGADGIAETWTTTSDAKVRTTIASLAPAFQSAARLES